MTNFLKFSSITALLAQFGCFGYVAEQYPDHPLPRIESEYCPDLSGLYELDGVSVDLPYYLVGEEGLFVTSSRMVPGSLLLLEQSNCKSLQVSLLQPHPVSRGYEPCFSCKRASVKSYRTNRIDFKILGKIAKGGASFFLGPDMRWFSLSKRVDGALLLNYHSFICGIALLPPVPICVKSASKKWMVLKQHEGSGLLEVFGCIE